MNGTKNKKKKNKRKTLAHFRLLCIIIFVFFFSSSFLKNELRMKSSLNESFAKMVIIIIWKTNGKTVDSRNNINTNNYPPHRCNAQIQCSDASDLYGTWALLIQCANFYFFDCSLFLCLFDCVR